MSHDQVLNSLIDSGKSLGRSPGSYRTAQHSDSLEAFCKPAPMLSQNLARARRSFSDRDADWLGIEGGTDAVADAVRNGWPEGVRKMEAAFGRLTQGLPEPTTVKRQRVWADAGDSFDVHRAMSGGLDRAWRSTRRQRTAQRDRRVTIVFNAAANCGVDAEALFWRGAAALALVDSLSSAGYSVELIAGHGAQECGAGNVGGQQQWTTTLVAPGAPVNLSSLAACLCLGGLLRVFGFMQILALPYTVDDGLGRPAEIELARIEGLDAESAASAVYIGSRGSPTNEYAALKLVAETLARLTGETAEA